MKELSTFILLFWLKVCTASGFERQSKVGHLIKTKSDKHFLLHSNKTQKDMEVRAEWMAAALCVLKLSSAEAELYALVKATSEALGQMSLLSEWGIPTTCKIWGDASAALGIIARSGLGKIHRQSLSPEVRNIQSRRRQWGTCSMLGGCSLNLHVT